MIVDLSCINPYCMRTVLHKNNSRGHANHGWLDTHHTFSFAGYYDPGRTRFGSIRVLNDDVVTGGHGFGTHPHSNMEIVSIPLKGALEHRDSTGRHKVIRTGEVQIMSAGTGIQHSEYNASKEKEVNFLQIWILPEKNNIEPRYDQKDFNLEEIHNELVNVVAPDNPAALWINQQAWFHLGRYEAHQETSYHLKDEENAVYVFVIEGEAEINGKLLQKRDGIGITETTDVRINPVTSCYFLLIETTLKV